MQLKDKTVLITGGTGYIGKNLVRRLLKEGVKSLRVFSRDEVKHYKLSQEFPDPRIRSLIGDVRDLERIRKAMKGVDIVFHAAALKRLDLIEYNVFEAIKTNVEGSMNVVTAAVENDVEKAILISTDKACSPVNSYGATKMLAERIFIESNYNKGSAKTILAAVRYGNVTESTGSVIPFFVDKMKKNEDIPLTDAQMTRFFISPDRAVDEIFKAGKYAEGGEIFVPKLSAFRISDLIEVLKKQYTSKSKVKIVGVRPGEKIHELMINEEEAKRAFDFQDSYAIISQIDYYQGKMKYDYLGKKQRFTGTQYGSKDSVVNQAKIRELLLKNKIIE